MPLTNGQILQGRYRIVSLLGQGGMGAVYLADDMRLTGRRCAIKENIPDPNASPQALARIRQQFHVEASTLATLDHPNLTKVSDYFSLAGNEYIVMDYAEGEDLESALKRQGGPLPEKPVLIWTDQVLDALEYLHNHRPNPIIHRDIKPANIVLTPQGKIKLVDFGLVKLLDPNDPRTATVMKGMGTPEYAPLEQYAGGAGHTDARSDIYSLGATLYHLLTDVVPPDVHQRLLYPTRLAPPRHHNPGLSAETEAAVLKAMEVYPDQRFQTAKEMRKALAGRRQPVVQPTPPPPRQPALQRPAPPAPPRPAATGVQIPRWVWSLLVGGLLFLAVFVAFRPTRSVPRPTITPVSLAAPRTVATPTGPGAAAFACRDQIGCVDAAPGNPVRIGYALVISGPNAVLGVDSRRGIEIAIDDRPEVAGHKVELVGEDAGCSADGGQAAATKFASDPSLIGVIGTNCSSAGVPAAKIISDAGMVLISPSNMAPSLTAPESHQVGYLRTAHNDKVQGVAMAEFAYNVLGARSAATIHDGSPYAEQLQQVFADTFADLGGSITSQEAVNVGDTDMRPVLTTIVVDKPDFLYYPIFIAEGAFITVQTKEVAGLENTILAGADGMISPDFVKAAGDAAEDMYVSGPNLVFENEIGQAFLAKHQAKYGEAPLSAFHAHAYDATMILLDAIEKVALEDADGTLHIGRQALRDALYATKNFQGITGNLTCDEFGDCADPKITIHQIQNGQYVPLWQWTK